MNNIMTQQELREAIYQACLKAAECLSEEQIKQISWFGRNVR
jgi:hypothetical protein